ncbi:Reverse transcriptase (RNA-dependent DNA polymerase) [Variovorax boronicumulans]|uniref:retron Ec67 family RNA-directed DNA polymerase/endonuclease n=1 Tax=Variovorax boronicumulans TaxID=436515 RepID=UPI000BB3A1EB|nr:retron Ec67 family RNA-directed DNA polymerase/endonuclease [Variovorax boronicumulans]PBI92175.1 Reverse transcriptase (RNA-dependent DNA polymerase) [Variovorax boronicumulans]
MKLGKLQAATSTIDLANLLGYQPSAFHYLIYKLSEAAKYSVFQIPKRNGGTREIRAPEPKLKLLQQHLAEYLSECLKEIESSSDYASPAHGFKPGRSIFTNAEIHRQRRFVLNIDLKDFFTTIHFGRVKGYFEKSREFRLNSTIALAIAKIACYDRCLPQGAPTSPVISNLIGRVLDGHMCKLAKKHKVTYSRYADDLTFSTNLKEFPSALAIQNEEHKWHHGKELGEVVKHAGFEINEKKTRVQYRASRQEVTGLIVNDRVSIRAEYRAWARVAVHRLVHKDGFFEPIAKTFVGPLPNEKAPGSLRKLEGILSFIYSAQVFRREMIIEKGGQNKEKKAELHSDERLYQKFLYYTKFYRNEKPLIVCEGKTDNVYIRAAIVAMGEKFPTLKQEKGEKDSLLVRFYPHPKYGNRLLEMGGGTAGLRNFSHTYVDKSRKFSQIAPRNPVIIVLDADDAGKSVYSFAQKNHAKKDDFQGIVFLHPNLYFICIPEPKNSTHKAIEGLFPSVLTDQKLGDKSFNWKNTPLKEKEYGKAYFAKNIVPLATPEMFVEFTPLLEGIAAAIEHFRKLPEAKS